LLDPESEDFEVLVPESDDFEVLVPESDDFEELDDDPVLSEVAPDEVAEPPPLSELDDLTEERLSVL
jgi:hypothetical protein